MTSLYDNIRIRRESLGMTQEELANALGYKSRSTIAKIESGENDITQNKISAFAKALRTTPAALMGWDDGLITNLFPLPKTRIPLIGTIAAGEPVLAVENIEEYIDLAECTNADFCLRVEGDSMIGAGIHSGDIVFIRQQPEVEDGEIAAVLIDEEATLKKVYKIGEVIQLRAENPKYPPITLNGEKNVRILGKAVSRLTKI